MNCTVSMANMDNMFFKLMLKDQWLIECPELHARVSAIQDPVWQGKFCETIRSESTAVNDCKMLLAQYDNYMQGHRDMMENGGPARTEDDVIRRFEDAVQQVKKSPDDVDTAQRLATECHVTRDQWADRAKFSFKNPDVILNNRINIMLNNSSTSDA